MKETIDNSSAASNEVASALDLKRFAFLFVRFAPLVLRKPSLERLLKLIKVSSDEQAAMSFSAKSISIPSTGCKLSQTAWCQRH